MITYTVKPIKSTDGKAFIREHHYSRGSHNGPTCYGLFDKDTLIGVLAIATPCSENVRASLWGYDNRNHVTELHRLVIVDDTPKNTESWFIARALKLHKQARPHIWGILSFADATVGHKGTIYQASNALFCGTSGKATFYLDENGRLRHPRQNGINITREMADRYGWKATKREGKYRYLFLMPDCKAHAKWLKRNLILSSYPYPN